MLSVQDRLILYKLRIETKAATASAFFKSWFFHPLVDRIVGEKFIELGNLLFIGLVVTEILQVQARPVFLLAGIIFTALCYTFGSVALKQVKESL